MERKSKTREGEKKKIKKKTHSEGEKKNERLIFHLSAKDKRKILKLKSSIQ